MRPTLPKSDSDTLPSDQRSARASRPPLRVPQLFVAFACDSPLAPPSRHSLAQVDIAHVGRGDARGAERGTAHGSRTLSVRIPDRHMSTAHVQIVNVLGRWILQDLGSTNGTLVNGEPEEKVTLADGDVIELGHTIFLFRDDVAVTPDDLEDFDLSLRPAAAPGFATLLPDLARQLDVVAQLAPSSVPLIIQAESGTGKELVARAAHALSGRKGPFIAVNCGAIPATLVETELFGYKRGAFSGATEERLGIIRTADGGTLFLDEIGDLPAASQASFLRVLQEQEVTPVGSARPVKVDVRIVAATHRNLDALVDEGRFRADLLARIAGYTVRLPPLRERREDLGLVIGTLLARLVATRSDRVRFSCAAASALFRYRWPLNVRELEKCLQTSVVLAGERPIDETHLPAAVSAVLEGGARGAEAYPDSAVEELTPDALLRRRELVEQLRAHAGNISAVARTTGKARMQIHRWMKRWSVLPSEYAR